MATEKEAPPIGPKTLHRLMVMGEDMLIEHLKEINEAVLGIEGKEKVSINFNSTIALSPRGGVALGAGISFATQRIRDKDSIVFDENQGELDFDGDD